MEKALPFIDKLFISDTKNEPEDLVLAGSLISLRLEWVILQPWMP